MVTAGSIVEPAEIIRFTRQLRFGNIILVTEEEVEKWQEFFKTRYGVEMLPVTVDPEAEIILYGSRSRGDSGPDSDWDLLILVEGPSDDQRADRIRHRLYEVEWECDEVISSIVRSRKEWNSGLYQVMPFHQSVEREGIRL